MRWVRLIALSALLSACGGETTSADAGPDGGRRDGATSDGSVRDAGRRDAALGIDATFRDAGIPSSDAMVGQMCNLNRECAAAQRCECDAVICTCQIGVRGTGANGITECVDGDDCVSALCVQGPEPDTLYCSEECETALDCHGVLPRCELLGGLGRICVRE